MAVEVGSRIGDYEIVSVLGAGGMGKVFKVRNVISDRIEAMKVLLPDLEHEPDLADRFMREIKVQASLQHPRTRLAPELARLCRAHQQNRCPAICYLRRRARGVNPVGPRDWL